MSAVSRERTFPAGHDLSGRGAVASFFLYINKQDIGRVDIPLKDMLPLVRRSDADPVNIYSGSGSGMPINLIAIESASTTLVRNSVPESFFPTIFFAYFLL